MSSASELALTPGRALGPYVVIRELGRGGMGVVYLGNDTRLDRQVAIKLVSLQGPATVARFMSEARVTARCKHPNIVVVYDVGEDDGHPYMVLEYVEGESALAMLQRGALPPEQVVALMTPVARALAFAHSRGIVHRDLKPANILVAADGTPKIVDFGIAKPFDGDGLAHLGGVEIAAPPPLEVTASHELVGTLHYLSPEQVRRDATDDRADLWSFGVTLYQLLSGIRPLDGLNRAELLDHLADLDRELPRLDQVAPAVPPALAELTHRCLKKRPELRMPSAAELVLAFEALAPTATEAVVTAPASAPASAPAPVPASRARPVRRLALAAAALLAVLAAVWLVTRPRLAAVATGETPPDPRIDARVAALGAEVARLDRAGTGAEADRMLDEFLREERDPRALALAWLERGDRERRRGDPETAVASFASAYARAGDADVRRRALLALADIYLERWEWTRLAAAMEVHDALPGPRDPHGAALRERLDLAIRTSLAATSSPESLAIAHATQHGRPTGLDVLGAVSVDVDGDGTPELVTAERDDLVIRTADGLRELSRRPHGGASELRCAGRDDRGAYVVGSPPRGGFDWLLLPLDGGAAVSLGALASGFAITCRWIDLDGQRGDELYFLAAGSLVQIARDASDAWSARTTQAGSSVTDVIGGDLDGDGQRELIVSVGEWRAYDVRVLRTDHDGTLRIRDRIRLGGVWRLADLGRDGSGGARIAAVKLDVYPTVRDLPPDRPFGAPAGLYVLRLRGDRLDIVRQVALPVPVVEVPDLGPLHVADLDGDGLRDLVARVALVSEQPSLLVMLGQRDGGFAARVVGGLAPLAVIPADGDPAEELVVLIEGAATSWILGGGDEPVPLRSVNRLPASEPSGRSRREPAIAAAWERAEELARIGQGEVAAEALVRVATLTAVPATKAAALRRAGVLLAAAGLPAAAPLEALAELAGAGERERVEAWLAAIDDDLDHVALVEAERKVAGLRAAGLTLTVDDSTRLAAQSAQLVGAPRPVFAGDTLTPPWRVADPSLVHVVPGSRELTIETLVPGVVASLPLEGGERGITVTIDAAVTRMEWAGNLLLRLGPRGGAADAAIEVEIGARGGGRVYRREYVCRGTYPSHRELSEPLPDADALAPVRIEISIVPTRGRARCSIVAGARRMTVDLDVTPSAGRDWELSLGASDWADMTSASVRISAVAVAGASPLASPPSPLDAASLELANHRAAATRVRLAELDPRTAATWPARRLAAMAADEAGDRRSALAALAAAAQAGTGDRPSTRELGTLVRARDGQFAPLVREAAGPRAALVLAAAWTTTAYHDLDEPRVRAALIRDLDGLPRATADTRGATLSMLGYRGEALFETGRPDEGGRALADALALAGDSIGDEQRDRSERISYLLAVDSATRGDEAAARRWALRSLELGSHPELAADRLLLAPAIRRLATGPGWEPVQEVGRTLVGSP